MYKKAFVAALVLSSWVGGQVGAQPGSSLAPAVTDDEREFLRRAITDSPYSALVVHTKVEILPMSAKNRPKEPVDVATEESHIYHARVLKTFRGVVHARIRYEMVVEVGEGAGISSRPAIVTLCRDALGRYWWPGPGATLEGKPTNVADATRLGKQLASSKASSFSDCR
jgi:hypothetical protein